MIIRRVVPLTRFTSKLTKFIKAHQVSQEDFDDFKRSLAEHPESGAIIQGAGGLRKTRLKSTSGGKRGGFRVCYYFHDVDAAEIFLIEIYPKNEKEDLTQEEKKDLKNLVGILKKS
jgi:hypothetical protein